MAINYVRMGMQIRDMRLRAGMTQMRLAEAVNCTSSFISHLESGRKAMSLDLFIQFANALKVSADNLLKGNLEYCSERDFEEMQRLLAGCSREELQFIKTMVISAISSMRQEKR